MTQAHREQKEVKSVCDCVCVHVCPWEYTSIYPRKKGKKWLPSVMLLSPGGLGRKYRHLRLLSSSGLPFGGISARPPAASASCVRLLCSHPGREERLLLWAFKGIPRLMCFLKCRDVQGETYTWRRCRSVDRTPSFFQSHQ